MITLHHRSPKKFSAQKDPRAGFGIVEVMVAAAILSTLTFLIIGAVGNQLREQSAISTGGDVDRYLNGLNLILARPDACSDALWNQSVDPNADPVVYFPYKGRTDIFLQKDQIIGNSKITDVRFSRTTQAPGYAVQRYANLEVTATHTESGAVTVYNYLLLVYVGSPPLEDQLIKQCSFNGEGFEVPPSRSTVFAPCHFGASLPNAIVGTNGDDNLTGGAGDDVLIGLDGNDTLNGGGGDDIICGGPGNDTIFTGAADACIVGSARYPACGNYADGGPGADNVQGSLGANILTGIDHIWGGDGDDMLQGAVGNDFIYGGDGNDTLIGSGNDDSLFGDAGDDVLTGDANNDLLMGGPGNDNLSGGDSNDEIHGGGGNDIISGGANSDNLYGDAGDDTITAALGNMADVHHIEGGSGNDNISGSVGRDEIFGGAGNDTLAGFGHDDRLFGDDGDDSLDGGAGTDDLDGGPGTDVCTVGENVSNCP